MLVLISQVREPEKKSPGHPWCCNYGAGVHRVPGFTVSCSWTKAISSPTSSNLHGTSENIDGFRVPGTQWHLSPARSPCLMVTTMVRQFSFSFTRLFQVDKWENAKETR